MISTRLTVIAAAALLLAACDLPHIREYAAASSKTMQDRSVADGFVQSDSRLSKATGASAQSAGARKNQQDMAKLQEAYQNYFDSIGALAAADLANYKREFAAFELQLAGSGYVTKSEANTIGAVGNAIAGGITDAYRHAKLKELIQTADPTVQKNMKNFQQWADDLGKRLAREEVITVNTLDGWYDRVPDGIQPAITDYKNSRLETIAADRKKVAAFKKATKAVALGHQELAKSVGKLNAEALVKTLKTHSDAIKDAYKSLTPTTTPEPATKP